MLICYPFSLYLAMKAYEMMKELDKEKPKKE